MTTINDLKGLVKVKEPDWNKVDKTIPKICNDQEFINWAYKEGLYDSERNVRDLAASVLEKTKILTEDMKDRLYQVMRTDTHIYARFRAACALAAHDLEYHADEIKKALESSAEEDPDIKDTADKYLKKYD
jgi:HEAT repeat protein